MQILSLVTDNNIGVGKSIFEERVKLITKHKPLICFVINFTRSAKITLRLVILPCFTLVLPGDTSASGNSSLVIILYRGPSVPVFQIKPIPSRQSGQP